MFLSSPKLQKKRRAEEEEKDEERAWNATCKTPMTEVLNVWSMANFILRWRIQRGFFSPELMGVSYLGRAWPTAKLETFSGTKKCFEYKTKITPVTRPVL